MGRGSGSIRPHLAVLLLLTGVLAGLLLRTPVPSVPTPLPQGEVGERIAAALPAELSPLRRAFVESGPPWWGGGLLLGRQVGRGGVGCALGRPGGGHRPGQQHQRGEPAFRAGLLRLRILVRRQRRRRPRRLCRRGQRRAGPAGPVRPGGLGRRPPRRSGLLSRPVPCGDRGRPGRGRRASGAPLLLLPGGRGVLLRRQGRGLYRPGPPSSFEKTP